MAFKKNKEIFLKMSSKVLEKSNIIPQKSAPLRIHSNRGNRCWGQLPEFLYLPPSHSHCILSSPLSCLSNNSYWLGNATYSLLPSFFTKISFLSCLSVFPYSFFQWTLSYIFLIKSNLLYLLIM